MRMFKTMRTALISLFCIIFVAMSPAQVGGIGQGSPRRVVDRFCELDASGKQLSSDGHKDMAPLFLDLRTRQNPEITLIKDYSFREPDARNDAAELAVEYRVFGRIDSSLRFTPQKAPYSKQPVLESEGISLVRSDTYFDLGSDGQWQQVKGAPAWRIKTAPKSPHLNLAAAMGYVRAESYKSKDPMVKANAQNTLRELQSLHQLQASAVNLPAPIQQSAMAILTQFTALETDGAAFSPVGLRQLDVFLVHSTPWQQDKIHIAKGYEVKTTPFSGSKADLYVEYTSLGELDASLRFTGVAPPGNIVREKFRLLFDNKYSVPARDNVPAKEFIGPSRWRIEDASAEQWLTVNAAIRYVEKMRDATTNSAVRSNAEKTLAILAHYR